MMMMLMIMIIIIRSPLSSIMWLTRFSGNLDKSRKFKNGQKKIRDKAKKRRGKIRWICLVCENWYFCCGHSLFPFFRFQKFVWISRGDWRCSGKIMEKAKSPGCIKTQNLCTIKTRALCLVESGFCRLTDGLVLCCSLTLTLNRYYSSVRWTTWHAGIPVVSWMTLLTTHRGWVTSIANCSTFWRPAHSISYVQPVPSLWYTLFVKSVFKIFWWSFMISGAVFHLC